MKFKINSKGRQGQTVVHYYDSLTQDIWTEDNIPVYLSEDPRCKGMVNTLKERKEQEFIQPDLKFLRIQLGLNCNFGCKYCSQRHGAAIEKGNHVIKLPDDVRVKNFIKLLKEKKITTQKIALWGGEPFVYWKLIKILVPALKELYPDTPIGTITNGSLLDDEKVDFCLKYGISLTMSHDAQAFTKYRNDKNPLDNPTVIKAIHRYIDGIEKDNIPCSFSINTVVVPENCDVLAIDSYFENKIGRKINWHFESIAKLDTESKNIISSFTEEQKKTLLNGLFALGTCDSKNAVSDFRHRVTHLLDLIINKVTVKDHLIPCDVANYNVIATTLDGEMLACHGANKTDFTIGYLKDLGSVKNTKVITWKNRPNCSSCPYVLFCGGTCATAKNEDVEAACPNMKLWYTAMFASAWFILFDVVIQSIEPVEE